MRPDRPLLLTALVTLFLAEGQRAFFASLFGLAYDALFPALRPGPALLGLVPFLVLFAPLLPLPRWLGRRGAVAVAALGVALFRLPMTHPALPARLVAGAVVVGCGAAFLTWAVGYVQRRDLGAGVVLGLVADQLLRLAGGSYDLSLRPEWLPVQAVLSLGLVVLVVRWTRGTGGGADQPGLERRAGGLRLRGALALGLLLFLDLHVVGLPPVVARWTGTGYPLAAAILGLAGATAVGLALRLPRPAGGRPATLALAALAGGGALAGYLGSGVAVAVLMAAAHGAALLLVPRALEPASGRRGGVMATAGFGMFFLATALYGLTFYAAYTVPAMDGGVPWILGVATALLGACFALLPRPAVLEPAPGPRPALLAGVLAGGVAVAAVAMAILAGRDPVRAAPATGSAPLRVVTWNVHYGFDERWRFEPDAMADVLIRQRPDVVALQEALVGAPTAYGVDLPRWIGRRAGLHDHFSATVNRLMGDAFLTRLEGAAADAMPLPGTPERKQLLRLAVPLGGDTVRFHALHLAVDGSVRPAQLRAALDAVEAGPAVVLGDLNAGPGSAVAGALEAAGFRDVFRDTGTPGPTFPARRPERRIDWIWVRGLRAGSAAVLRETSSDHRPVAATLHIGDRWIRSTDAHDLQAP